LTIGARYFKDKNTTVNSSFGLLAGGTIAPVTIKSEEDGVNPKATLSYKIVDDHMVYASASKGFRPGGPNTPVPTSQCSADLARLGLSAAPTGYDSDSLWNYEIGSKNQFANRRLTVNGAAYFIDWTDIQQSVSLSCGFPFIGNVGEAESKGVELEIDALLTDNLQVGFGAALTDTKITKTVPGVTAQVDDDILGVPNTVLNGYVQYTMPLSSDYSLRARADHQYRSSQLQAFEDTIRVNIATGGTATIPNPGREQGSTSLTNLSLGFGAPVYDMTLYVHNLFDRDDVTDPNVLLRIPQQSALQPRTIGLEAAYRF
jgi:iron complex outermembrane receptor protein